MTNYPHTCHKYSYGTKMEMFRERLRVGENCNSLSVTFFQDLVDNRISKRDRLFATLHYSHDLTHCNIVFIASVLLYATL